MAPKSKKLLREIPSDDEMNMIISRLKDQGDRAVAIIGMSYLDYGLGAVLKAKFVKLNKNEHDRIFLNSKNGILSTTSAKIRICHALGILTEYLLNLGRGQRGHVGFVG